jgi:hypothetical protein
MYKAISLGFFLLSLVMFIFAQSFNGVGEEAGYTGAILEVISIFVLIFSMGAAVGGFIAKKWG